MKRSQLFALCVLGCVATSTHAQQAPTPKTGEPTARIPDSIVMEADVEYGRAGDRPLLLDLLRPKDQGDKVLPVVVFVHGGGWRSGSKETGRRTLADLVATGNYIGVTVGYRLTGEAIWPAQIHDCKAAIRWLRASADKYRLDPARIGATGGSAGGHLVALLGTSGDVSELEGENGHAGYSSRVQCVVDFCGPSDFAKFYEQRADIGQKMSSNLFGGSISEHAAAIRAASPVTWASSDDPPFMVVHGTADKTVPIAQGEAMVAALEKVNTPVMLIRMEGGGHGIGGEEINRRRQAFFDRHLRHEQIDISSAPIQVEGAATDERR